jgi:hypothetical protein
VKAADLTSSSAAAAVAASGVALSSAAAMAVLLLRSNHCCGCIATHMVAGLVRIGALVMVVNLLQVAVVPVAHWLVHALGMLWDWQDLMPL